MEHAEGLGIELLFLPPYSPNLNLIERWWKLTKRRCLTNRYYRYYRDFGSFCGAIDRCLDDLGGRLKPEMRALVEIGGAVQIEVRGHNAGKANPETPDLEVHPQ